MAKKIYKVTEAQYKTLQEGGTITVGGVSYTYETGSDVAYTIVDPTTPEYRLRQIDDAIQLTKDGSVVSDLSVAYSDRAGYSTFAHSLVHPSTDSATYTFNLLDGGTVNGLTNFNNGINVSGTSNLTTIKFSNLDYSATSTVYPVEIHGQGSALSDSATRKLIRIVDDSGNSFYDCGIGLTADDGYGHTAVSLFYNEDSTDDSKYYALDIGDLGLTYDHGAPGSRTNLFQIDSDGSNCDVNTTNFKHKGNTVLTTGNLYNHHIRIRGIISGKSFTFIFNVVSTVSTGADTSSSTKPDLTHLLKVVGNTASNTAKVFHGFGWREGWANTTTNWFDYAPYYRVLFNTNGTYNDYSNIGFYNNGNVSMDIIAVNFTSWYYVDYCNKIT